MSKRSKHATFSVDSLREEVQREINQEAIDNKLLCDIWSIDLNSNLFEHTSVEVLLCAVIIRFGLDLVCSLANIALALCVLPKKVCAEVLRVSQSELKEDDAEVLFNCVKKLKSSNMINTSLCPQVYVFTPPVSHCLNCNMLLVQHNEPVRAQYHHHYGTSKAVKVSLKCNRWNRYYGYSKHGNPQSGWSLYPKPRSAVEASDTCFVERSLLKWQISLA